MEFAKGPHNPKKSIFQFVANITKNKHKNCGGLKSEAATFALILGLGVIVG